MSDDEAARNANAASLREQINRLKSSAGGPASEDDTVPEPQPPEDERSPKDSGTVSKESPRDFVQRRTRELEKKKQ